MPSSKLAITVEEFDLFREYIRQISGVAFTDEKLYLVESRLSRLVTDCGFKSFKELYIKAKADSTNKLRDKVIDAIMTNETMWFRDPKHWEFIKNQLLPRYINELRIGQKEKIAIWSVASSTGQEPYSIAMLINECLTKEPKVSREQFVILATDISPSSIFMAMSGRYSSLSMARGLLPGFLEKYFVKHGDIYEIIPEIKQMVMYKQFNLQEDFKIFPNFDLIICKNVSIYFTREGRKELFRKLHQKLVKDGIIILGGSENLLSYSDKYDQFDYEKNYYYKPIKK